ncbi:MAG TPA: metalloregulator ArsR/SmtB family transcription factor [Thermoanaerobaculia bacterium]|nr:metalloregulator ArsR/SmtB family transcription factor [Thermoanaerobaculia bacterium]
MKKSRTTADELAALFLALGDRTRLRLLNLMLDGEVCVCFFVEVLGELQPKISRHLASLRSAGLVSARRDAKWAHYAITPPDSAPARAAFDAIMATMKEDRQMQRDRATLARVCCSTRAPELLKRAPRPAIASRDATPDAGFRNDRKRPRAAKSV